MSLVEAHLRQKKATNEQLSSEKAPAIHGRAEHGKITLVKLFWSWQVTDRMVRLIP